MELKVFVNFKLLVPVVMILLLKCITESSFQCSKTVTKFSVTSSRDENGHWTPTVEDLGNEQQSDTQETSGECLLTGIQKIEFVAKVAGSQCEIPPGYQYYPGVGYYKYHTTEETWDAARKICVDENAHLAIINSEEEANITRDIMQQHPTENGTFPEYASIGFHSRFEQGEYLTVLGTSLANSGFYIWADTEPNNTWTGLEPCGSIKKDAGLNDISCYEMNYFFCELVPCDSRC